jgi:hypothetical protein
MDFWSGTSQGTSFELNSNYGERAQKWGDRDQNWGAEPVPVFGQAPTLLMRTMCTEILRYAFVENLHVHIITYFTDADDQD